MVILIIQKVDWELIRHKNQAKINKDNIRENNKRVDYNYKVGDKVMINNHAAYKYEIPHKGPFPITKCWNNGMVILQCGATKIRCNILHNSN